ncbi:MAG: DUF3006 family protein [Candidatus Kerfeldbacteria bacterium]
MFEDGMSYDLNVTIKKFEGIFALIETEDNQLLKWPIKNLPDDVKEGASLRLAVSTEKTDEESREKLARTVLNSILAG